MCQLKWTYIKIDSRLFEFDHSPRTEDFVRCQTMQKPPSTGTLQTDPLTESSARGSSNVWPIFGKRDQAGRRRSLAEGIGESDIDSGEAVRHDALPSPPRDRGVHAGSVTQAESSQEEQVSVPGSAGNRPYSPMPAGAASPTRRQKMPQLAREAKVSEAFGEGPSGAGAPEQSTPRNWQQTPGDRHNRLAQTLDRDIIPRLMDVHRTVPSAAVTMDPARLSPTTQEVEDFVRLVLALESVPAQDFIDVMSQRGMSVETMYLDLLAPAAQHLSYLWSQDLCDFTQVTLGLARLQRLLHELSPGMAAEQELRSNARRVLLLPVRGEQQTFGLSMVAEFFHHAGWEVDCGSEASVADAAETAQQQWFDVVGLSAGSETSLDELRVCIQQIRELSRNPRVAVVVGGPIFAGHPERVKFVGADAFGLDGKQAPAHAERLIDRRPGGRST
ncbi:MAG: hypothetical protein EOO26_01305 [Comamonadaceae bacterium]|nr:MAG: hypothetical protein EOO26_01305 [Comamonadaceae bacterium]